MTSRITQTTEMPKDASPIWQSLYRAILSALQGVWGDYDVSVTNATNFKCEKRGRMAWVSFDGSGNVTVNMPITFSGNPVLSVSNGTATISGSTATITASGAWSFAAIGRVEV